jgi:hypothetical protein
MYEVNRRLMRSGGVDSRPLTFSPSFPRSSIFDDVYLMCLEVSATEKSTLAAREHLRSGGSLVRRHRAEGPLH